MPRRLPEPIEMIRRLVERPSISAADPRLDQSNREVVELLAEWAEALGFAAELVPVTGVEGKWNLIAKLGSGDGGLVLAGHTDTVPYDEGAWGSDPFALTERGGRLYGLGATDMKGFFGLALEAASAFRAADLLEPLILLGTADEESTMSGARCLATSSRVSARHAVIGEPTDLAPVRAHKGIFFESIQVRGRTGHSSDPGRGANAIEAMHAVIGALLAWRDELARKYRDDRFAVPIPTMNLGRVEGGDAANRIAAQCRLTVDLRPLPGMCLDELREQLRARVKEAISGRGVDVSFDATFEGVPAFECPATAAIVQAAESLSGAEAGAVMFGTEGPFMQAMGMETIILGAGSIEVAHRPDEFLEAAQIEPAIDIYGKLIHRFCVESPTT